MTDTDPRPPRLAARLIERSVSTRVARHGILGDLEEEYRRRRRRRPAFLCDLWYWLQSLLVWARYRWEPDEYESARGNRWIDDLRRDVTRAFRGLLRSKRFTAIALTVLGLGIGVNTAIFSVINGVLIRPLPFDAPEELVQVFERHQEAGWDRFSVSDPNAIDLQSRATSFQGVGVTGNWLTTITVEGNPQRLDLGTVTPGFFDLLGVVPLVGRTLRETDVEGTEPGRVLMLSEDLWVNRFGADPQVVGRTVSLGGLGYLVVGVLPRGPAWLGERDAYIPLVLDAESPRNSHRRRVIARLRDGIGIESAQAELTEIAGAMREDFGQLDQDIEFVVDPSSIWAANATLRRSLWVFMGSAGFLLLIACMNLANLQLARLSGRVRQVTLSVALGAGRGRILRQLLTESVVLGVLGGAIGIAVAWLGLRGLMALEPGNVPRLGEVEVDQVALLFAFLASLVATTVAGLLPAKRAFSSDIGNALRGGGARTSLGRTGHRIQSWLIGTETALSLVLLIGAALLIRSLIEVQAVDSGFDANGRVTFEVALPESYGPDEGRQFRADFLSRLRSLPQVVAAAAVSHPPVSGAGVAPVLPRDETPEMFGGNISADWRLIGDDYFGTLGVSVVQGRDLDHRVREYPGEVVISESLASALWPGQDAVGREIELYNDPEQVGVVVGVVEDMVGRGVEVRERLAVYPSFEAFPFPFPLSNFVVHVRGDASAVIPAVRRLLAELDSDLPVSNVLTLDDRIQNGAASRRFTTVLLMVFAGLALILAVVGLYGVVAQSIAQRSKELGVRVAFGAQSADIMRVVMRRGLRPAAFGILFGLVATLWMSQMLAALLFGVSPTDPATYVGAALMLGVTAVVACWVPARSTLGLDAIGVLQGE